MKIILISLLITSSCFAAWHPWTEQPEDNQLYIYETEAPFMYPYKNKIWVVSPFLTYGTYTRLEKSGWHDFSWIHIKKLVEHGETIMFFPSDKLPSWIE